MANIFISYQRSDTLLLAHCLGYALRAAGHLPFVDTGGMPAGTAFIPFIDGALSRSDLVLVLIGPAFDFERLRQDRSVVAFEWRRARFHGCAVLPVVYECQGRMPTADHFPAELHWLPSLNARFVSALSLTPDVDAIVELVPTIAHPPRPSAHILWIDDDPKQNIRERRHLRETAGLSFDNVVSTAEAVDQLRNALYDLVITDIARYTLDEQSPASGLEGLRRLLQAGSPPVIVYAGRGAVAHRDEVLRLGGFGSTDSPRELYALIDLALGRTLPTAGTPLER